MRLVPGPSYVVTVLRDPAERILSTYYFWKRHRPEIVRSHNLAGPAAARATDLLGFLQSTDPAVRDAVRKRQLLLEAFPGSTAAQGVVAAATRLAD